MQSNDIQTMRNAIIFNGMQIIFGVDLMSRWLTNACTHFRRYMASGKDWWLLKVRSYHEWNAVSHIMMCRTKLLLVFKYTLHYLEVSIVSMAAKIADSISKCLSSFLKDSTASHSNGFQRFTFMNCKRYETSISLKARARGLVKNSASKCEVTDYFPTKWLLFVL